MGRTLPSATQVFIGEEQALAPFRKALSRRDQLALDELFNLAHRHLAPAAYAAHALPMEIFLLAMILEEHKEIARLRSQIEALAAVAEAAAGEEVTTAVIAALALVRQNAAAVEDCGGK